MAGQTGENPSIPPSPDLPCHHGRSRGGGGDADPRQQPSAPRRLSKGLATIAGKSAALLPAVRPKVDFSNSEAIMKSPSMWPNNTTRHCVGAKCQPHCDADSLEKCVIQAIAIL
jgi:hypothetical protein